MSEERQSLFLERRAYRQRRLSDAARLLPVIGAIALCLPMLWGLGQGDAARTTFAMRFVFLLWLAFIAIAFLLSRRLPAERDSADKDETTRAGSPE